MFCYSFYVCRSLCYVHVNYNYIYTTIGELSAKICPHKYVLTNLSSKCDKFLAERSQFDSDHGVNFYAPTCCQPVSLDRFLHFNCPFFYIKKIIMSHSATDAMFTLQFSH